MVLGTIVHGLEVGVLLLIVLMCVQVYRVQRSERMASNGFHQAAPVVQDDTVITVENDVIAGRMQLSDSEQLSTESATQTEASSALSTPLKSTSPKSTSPQNAFSENASAKSGRDQSVQVSGSSAILNDYIGEFFSDTQTTNLDAYRNTSAESAPVSVQGTDKQVNGISAADDSEAAKLEAQAPTLREISSEELAEFKVAEDKASVKTEAVELELVPPALRKSSTVLEPPTLLEPVLLDSASIEDADDDAFIVVEDTESSVEKIKSADVMSDKVVHAMLKEAKLAYPS